MLGYGMAGCFAWEALLWNEADALESAIGMLEAEHWPEGLQELHEELLTALEALPQDAPWEMVEAVLEPVQEHPALMFAMPCLLSAGAAGIEFGLGEGVQEALLYYGIDVCGAWDIALEGGADGKYDAIAVLEVQPTVPPTGAARGVDNPLGIAARYLHRESCG